MNRKSSAFTLTEILVVCVIIAVLLAILIPVFMNARQKSKQSTCTTNIHQAAMMVLMYAQDNDDRFPREDTWNLWNTPSDMEQSVHLPTCPSFVLPPKDIEKSFGYAMNRRLIWAEGNESLSVTSLPYPNNTVLVTDGAAGENLKMMPDMCKFKTTCIRTTNEESHKRHLGGAMYGFTDGHVKWFEPNQVTGFLDKKPGHNDGHTPTFAIN